MNTYRLPIAYHRVAPDPPGRIELLTEDGLRRIIFAGTAADRVPRNGASLNIEELRAAGPAGRAILILRDPDHEGGVEARGWWVHESRPGFYAQLHAPFLPDTRTRVVALILVSLLGLPGMRFAIRRWHARRTA